VGASAIWNLVYAYNNPGENQTGLLNAIYGSIVMTIIGIIVGTPIGVLAGTYMAEYGRFSKLTTVVRFINDILLSAPSIIIGLFVYELMVRPMGHFSAIAGAVALAILVIPVVVRTTEDMLNLVPNALREAGTAIGAPRWVVIRSVAYRAALSGIVTGILLAIARISGETAPLLFTALFSSYWLVEHGVMRLMQPTASLAVLIYNFSGMPFENQIELAWAASLVLVMIVLFVNIVSRLLGRRRV